MPICNYRRCSQEFISNPKHIGSDNEQKFCCRQHGVNERSLIRSENNRKPILTKECAYRLCNETFHTRDTKKLFCSIKHQRAEQRLRGLELQSKADFRGNRITIRQRQKAREFAALHCVHYSTCICGIRINCLNCQRADIQENAWQREPGVLYNPNGDYHSIRLPSTGRSE